MVCRRLGAPSLSPYIQQLLPWHSSNPRPKCHLMERKRSFSCRNNCRFKTGRLQECCCELHFALIMKLLNYKASSPNQNQTAIFKKITRKHIKGVRPLLLWDSPIPSNSALPSLFSYQWQTQRLGCCHGIWKHACVEQRFFLEKLGRGHWTDIFWRVFKIKLGNMK